MKPNSQVASENLRCFGYKLPPAKIEISPNEKTTKIDAYGAFSSDWVKESAKWGASDYDIAIDLPHSDYMIDAELKTDFLTTRMQMKLFGQDNHSEEWHTLGISHWFNENSYDDLSVDANAMMSTKIGDLSMA